MAFAGLLSDRSAGDLLSRVVRLRLGDREYTLPVLKSGPNARWQSALDDRFRSLLSGIQAAENDQAQITAHLIGAMQDIKAALYEYDQSGVLPPVEELDELVDDIEYLMALLGVWQAANPLVGIAIALMTGEAQTSASSAPTNTPPSRTTGRRRSSRKN